MTAPKIKILLIGSVLSSETALRALLDLSTVEICGLVTTKINENNSDYRDLSLISHRHGIPTYHISKKWDNKTLKLIKEMGPSLIFCIGWSFILPSELIRIPSHGVLGYHPAKLPQNRGRHPIIWAIAMGLSETASSFFFIDEKIDSGPIVDQRLIAITETDNAKSVYKKLTDVIPSQIETIVTKFIQGDLPRIAQDRSSANYWRKRSHDDGVIDWRMSAQGIRNLIRALSEPMSALNSITKANI